MEKGENKMNEELFYCYSPRLAKFAEVNGVKAVKNYEKNKEGNPLWVFRKNEKFNSVLSLYAEMKNMKKKMGMY